MKNFKTEGIIIRRRNIGEADKLLTVMTKDNGKLTVKAAGVRRIRSRRSPHVELLNLSLLHLYKGPGIPVLTEATTIDSFPLIKQDLGKVGYAYHICELIDGLCPEYQENEQVYYLLKNTLSKLEKTEEVKDIIHQFEVQLLTMLGFWRVPSQIPTERVNTQSIIENLLERKLKSKQILSQLS